LARLDVHNDDDDDDDDDSDGHPYGHHDRYGVASANNDKSPLTARFPTKREKLVT
jgi:hypothetical protein